MMYFTKFLSLIYTIKTNFRWLPDDIRAELNNVLQYYSDLCIIAKIERR